MIRARARAGAALATVLWTGVAFGLDIVPPAVVVDAAPVRPPGARRDAAVVRVAVTVDVEGSVDEARIAGEPDADLDDAALDAVRRMRFSPARRDGVPTPARIVVEVRFPKVPDAEPTSIAAPPAGVSGTAAPPRELVPQSVPAVATEEVRVTGVGIEGRRQRSADAVTVVDTRLARRESADLGDVVARTQGVAFRRAGGLGSITRLSLNGLYDEQIRFFLDGVPLELAGFGVGFASVPVDLVDRVEVYRGVLPSRYGADALGGAVDLVTDVRRGPRATLSYQVGSFGTYRIAARGRAFDAERGLFALGSVHVDRARNDYTVDVEVPNARGQLRSARVRRFHDAYAAEGASLEAGLVDRPWARRLSVRVFGTNYEKELQHNFVMTVPYGEARYGERAFGATLRWEVGAPEGDPGPRAAVVAAYADRRIELVDTSARTYDWFGRAVGQRATGGEIRGVGLEQMLEEHSWLARARAIHRFDAHHELELALSPTVTSRSGENRARAAASGEARGRDAFDADRDLVRVVTAVEHRADVLDRRLANTAFAKHYHIHLASDDPLTTGERLRTTSGAGRFGIGDALRVFVARDVLWAKASYELATRLPNPDEAFGNGVLVLPNVGISPETSHNANLGLTGDLRRTAAGDLRFELNGFYREARDLITLLVNQETATYQNIFSARIAGVESSAGWTSRGGWVALDGNLSYQDARNVSGEGPFARYDGDRIPNRPWLFANAVARLTVPDVLAANTALGLSANARYVHGFFRGWESLGDEDTKQRVPAQLLFGAGLSYRIVRKVTTTATLEVQNLADARAFDFVGVQRPGRAVFFKGLVEL